MSFRAIVSATIICFLVLAGAVNAAMTSTNFEIGFDSINSGGLDTSSSTNYSVYDTVGEQATGYTTSTNYTLHAGYRQTFYQYTPSLSFSIGVQENSTQTSYSALSLAQKTVTVASVASYSIDSNIGVVENLGLNQKFIVGKIISIDGNTITVDKWDGNTDTISESPLGGDDYVFRLDGHAGTFGQLSASTGKTLLARTEVNTNAPSGYKVQIQSDGYLASGSTHIMDVADGAVTLGAEEYGGRVFGTNATSTGSDFAITNTLREIQTSTTTVENDRIGMVYKITIHPGTPAGNYTQKVNYLLTANF